MISLQPAITAALQTKNMTSREISQHTGLTHRQVTNAIQASRRNGTEAKFYVVGKRSPRESIYSLSKPSKEVTISRSINSPRVGSKYQSEFRPSSGREFWTHRELCLIARGKP